MVAEAVSETSELKSIREAVVLIDGGLSALQHREIVSAGEVADLLLDVRTLLVPLTTAVLDEGQVPVAAN